MGNNPRADGSGYALRDARGHPRFEQQDAKQLAEQALGRPLTPGQVSSYWTGEALRYIRSRPGHWLKLMGRKLALALTATEVMDTVDPYTCADWSRPLRWCHTPPRYWISSSGTFHR